MPTTYPPASPTVSGDFYTISRWLNSPTLVQRRIQTLAMQRWVGERLLTGRVRPSGGAISFETAEPFFPDRDPESIAPGQEFPVTTIGEGAVTIAAVRKWGLDTLVTDESIRRQNRDPVDRAMRFLANGIVRQVDRVILSAMDAAATQTLVGADWTTAATDIILQLATALNMIRQLDRGFEGDTLVIDDTRWLDLLVDRDIRDALPRESNRTVIQTGDLQFPLLGIRQILVTPNLPTAGSAFVLDSSAAGGVAEEVPLYARSFRDDERERWRLRAGRVLVPYVQEPQAIVEITGV